MAKILASFPCGSLRVMLYKGDITELDVDVIMNETDPLLKQVGRGSKQIASAAGPRYIKDCNKLIGKFGPINVTKVMSTTAGDLSYKAVLHAIAPRFPKSQTEAEINKYLQQLKEMYTNLLNYANQQGYGSIGLIPIYAGQKDREGNDLAWSPMFEAISSFGKPDGQNKLKEVDLMTGTEDVNKYLKKSANYKNMRTNTAKSATKRRRPEPSYSKRRRLSTVVEENEEDKKNKDVRPSTPAPPNPSRVRSKAGFTVKGLKVYVYKAIIVGLNVDAIVNPTDKKLRHDSGLSKVISKTAGKQLARVCEAYIKEKGRVKRTEVVRTMAGKMNCKALIHAVGPKWRGSKGRDEYLRQLRLTVINALNCADKSKYKHIALPAICSDDRGLQNDLGALASTLVRAITVYINDNANRALQEIHVVANTNDMLSRVINILKQDKTFIPIP